MTRPRLPDFIIIGAMKAATSTVYRQLAAQRGIFMAEPKEPNFFSDAERWALGLDWYRGLFAIAEPGDLCGEASTHYTKLPTFPEALPRLRAALPDVRLVYMMRHPVDRLISHFSHGWLERSIDVPIDMAIETHPELIDYGRYAMQITPWLDAFGPEAILPVFAERLAAFPENELGRICRHIGYERQYVRADIGAQNVSGERLRDAPWRDILVHNAIVTPIRRTLIPQSVRDWVKRQWQMAERPALGSAAQRKAVETFDRDLGELGRLLGTELDCANFNDVVRAQPLGWR